MKVISLMCDKRRLESGNPYHWRKEYDDGSIRWEDSYGYTKGEMGEKNRRVKQLWDCGGNTK